MADLQTIPQNTLVLYKNLGETPRECVERFKTQHPEYAQVPMTYAGRLDPMAEGLLLVLSGSAIAEKETFTNLPKTYEFEMLWGVETDTADVLGLVSVARPSEALEESLYHLSREILDETPTFPDADVVKQKIEKLTGKFAQKYPAYSSRTVVGTDEHGKRVTRSLIEWARLGQLHDIEIPSHDVEIFSAEHVSRKFMTGAELLKNIAVNIALVRGDFRQEKIMESWQKFLAQQSDTQFALDTVRLDVSGGFYVRQFVSDIARAFHTTATTYHILRTRVGNFSTPTTLADLH